MAQKAKHRIRGLYSQDIRRKDPVVLPPAVAKRCPFCGSQPHIQGWHGGGIGKRIVSCQSEYCHANPGVSAGSRTVANKTLE
jgi:hypothetical protein